MALIFESIQTDGIAQLSYLVGDDTAGIAAVFDPRPDVDCFVRTGHTKFVGYLVGGMQAWNNAGLPLESVGQMPVHEVKSAAGKVQILDVRAPAEWKDGHIPNARHVFLGELREHLGKLDKGKPTAVYCDSGYRASIATRQAHLL